MDGLYAVLVALLGTIGTIVVAAIRARQSSHRDGASTAARWREQAELEKARADLLSDQLAEEREGRAADAGILERERARLAATQHDLDDCARQRDDAFSELRAARRRRTAEPSA